ncbi:hypothetical protein NPIL_275231 [Nephila pilipes]|uniref:Uncharacterized protein n=1 Tax=Nephila pilipes TaxID=299642 RepID=A0A8X6UQ31_NEPPI|nr:hypothetical protein NPIL_275231 [Nephila pilipes]
MSNLNPGSNIFYPTSSVTNENVQSSFYATSSVQNRLMNAVLLSTAPIFRDKYGNLQSARELLDAGNQSDIMTKECANRLRFVHNCKPGNEKCSGHWSGTQIDSAEQILAKCIQTSEFSKECNALQATGEVNADSQSLRLNKIFANRYGIFASL